jgi:hypothetical protein
LTDFLLSILKNEQLFQLWVHGPEVISSVKRRQSRGQFPLTPGFSRVILDRPRRSNRFNGFAPGKLIVKTVETVCIHGLRTTGLKPGFNEIFISRGINRPGLWNYP